MIGTPSVSAWITELTNVRQTIFIGPDRHLPQRLRLVLPIRISESTRANSRVSALSHFSATR